MTIEQIRQKLLNDEPELSWVWEVLEGKQLPITEYVASLSVEQLYEIQNTIKIVRAADRTNSPMALLAMEQLVGNIRTVPSVPRRLALLFQHKTKYGYFDLLNISGLKLCFRLRAMLFILREPLAATVLHFSIPYSRHRISVMCCFPAFRL